MREIYILTICIIFLLLLGCKRQSEEVTKTNLLTLNLNSQQISFSRDGQGNKLTAVIDSIHYPGRHLLLITGFDSVNKRTIKIECHNINSGKGNYSDTANSNGANNYVNLNYAHVAYFPYDLVPVGTYYSNKAYNYQNPTVVNITEINRDYVKGTFNSVLYYSNNSNDSVFVKRGEFSISF